MATTEAAIISPDAGPLPAAAGGKANALARLSTAGFPPPKFFVILPSAFDMDGLQSVFASALRENLEKLGPGPYAVRSSGAQEDGAAYSHAGQFLSLLNVPSADVADAAHQVWRSGFSDNVMEYRDAWGLDGANAAPAVVIQEMAPADVAGVAFSADPVSGLRHHTVVSAIPGLGDRLVSGEEDGETWMVDTLQNAIVSELSNESVLDPSQVFAVAQLAKQIEAAFGAPQDIEWAIGGDELYILQARPITTELKSAALFDNQRLVFDNSNIVESYPGVVTPLTYSFARYVYARVYPAFLNMVGVKRDIVKANAAVFENMLARIDARVYYNLGNWYRALALLPGFAVNRAHMETMMGLSEPLPESITSTIGPRELTGLSALAEYGRMARAAIGLLIQAIRLPKTIGGFQKRLDDALGPQSLDIGTASLSALAAEYRRIEASLLDQWDAPIVNDFLCMMAFGASRKLMQRWFGEAGLELHNHVMIGQGDIISAEPARRISTMGAMAAKAPGLAEQIEADGLSALDGYPELRAEFDAYIERFGDRCTEELKLESVTLDEDPSVLLAAIAASARRPTVTHTENKENSPDFLRLAQGKPLKRIVARAVVGWSKERVRDRENLRFERTRIFGRARKVFMAMARELVRLGHLDDPRDVFFLTVEELLGATEGFGATQDLRPLVRLRREEMDRSAAQDDPPERIAVQGAAINICLAKDRSQSAAQEAGADSEIQRTGTACSAGVVTARARVIRDPAKQSIEPGDILVARHTDPGWIAVFSNASAIVVERGSLLSHSAIVAREMGIPCVVALKRATEWIKDCETISVDGGSGVVTRDVQ